MPCWKKAGWRHRAGSGAGVIGRVLAATGRLLGRFSADRSGNVFVIFGLSATVLVIAIGAGLDLANAFTVRQKLSNAATLTCQFANRSANVVTIQNGASGATTYQTAVTNFANTSKAQQAFSSSITPSVTPSFGATGTTQVVGWADVPTNFMQIIGVLKLTPSVTISCGNPAVSAQPTPGGPLKTEGFENAPCNGTCYVFINQSGGTGTQATSSSTTPTVYSYIGATGTQFKILGYCLEIDSVGIIRNNVPEGSHSAELDCDNGSGSRGNSSISTLITNLAAGEYELRYNYASRVHYLNYDPVYICGSTASDVAWANDNYGQFGFFVTRSNQINVYFDNDTSGGTLIPLHTTIDGTQQLGGSNLIDMCVDSWKWIERSVRISVTTAGNYWLSFAADGTSDSYGGQIDNIRFCNNPCPGALQDNFPFTANQVIFEDKFDSPATAQVCNAGGCGNLNTTLNAFYGTSGTASSGWPNETARGWATAPYNQTNIEFLTPAQGTQYIQVEGNQTSGQTTSNHTVARYFYLDPGYYQISYYYISDVLFALLPTTNCSYPPYTTATFSPSYPAQTASSGGINRISAGAGTWVLNTNEVAVFLSNSQLVSYPNGGGVLNSTTTYTNPDGTVSTTPTVAPDFLNIYAYDGTKPNALIDFCFSSPSWVQRTTTVKITKPGQYWLSFASMGSSDSLGGAIDDVKLTALGSLYMAVPPVGAVTIQTAGPAPDSTLSFTGFSIVADPLKPPAP